MPMPKILTSLLRRPGASLQGPRESAPVASIRAAGRARNHLRIAALAVAILSVPVAAGAAEQLQITYGLSLAGLPIGTATLGGQFNRDGYKVDVRAKMTGLAGLLTSGRGAGTSSGTTAAGKVLPSAYALTSGGGSGTYTVRMALASGNVAGVEITPPLDPAADRVPLLDMHKRGVVDPVSALIMPVAGQGPMTDPSACNRTIPVFDGAGRFDVSLTFTSTQEVDLPGYKGPVLVCQARYTPIAGHRTGRKATQFMAENKDMEAWLAPVEGTRVLVPVKISVRTMIGTTVIDATRLAVASGAAPAGQPVAASAQ
jgi:hypothetical protein